MAGRVRADLGAPRCAMACRGWSVFDLCPDMSAHEYTCPDMSSEKVPLPPIFNPKCVFPGLSLTNPKTFITFYYLYCFLLPINYTSPQTPTHHLEILSSISAVSRYAYYIYNRLAIELSPTYVSPSVPTQTLRLLVTKRTPNPLRST